MEGPMSDKVVITCALTGVLARREQCPWVPYTPAEIAEEARRAYEAGAAVVHIHARTDEGAPTYEPAVYADIRREIEARCPVILNFSTGGIGPMEGRVAHIREVRPALGALNMGSMNYAKYSARRKEFVFDFVFENTFKDIAYLLTVMKEALVKPELECFDVGHTNSIWPLIDQGLLKRPLQFSFIMGVLGGIRATAENLAVQAREAPPDSTWEVVGISHEQWRMASAALALGGNVRVGSKIRQGITTEITGEGESIAPTAPRLLVEVKPFDDRYGIRVDWSDLNGYFQRFRATLNLGTFFGAATARALVLGYGDVEANPAQIQMMQRLVGEAIEQGALGLSTALIYPPGSFARTPELIELAKVAARHGGIYATHV